ncbi:hypothetical protein Lal_00050237 [Lupinus albus]|uniref:Uncharacterized protein n=1 Tax=Lupinus albus TaxID=3870 RepID=A0A6A5M6S8_LUPAL|nr:hypothetical protein Lalb_Chr12g0196771 [Lupinus albus]KAF1867803.1 hypothetical protein Lal_00050237 [Lupinus albus]
MDEVVKEHSSSGNSSKPKLLRYALRSSTKSKDQNLDAPNSSQSNRGRSTPSSVSKSVGVLDFSGKDKSRSAKPPRRYSIPSPKLVGNNTPVSATRTKMSANGQGPQSRNQTPISDISRTSTRVRFNLLSSASYWLNQIKLSESAAKHSISLGFFKLALEAGCEPFQKMKDELKSYVRRHQLAAELGEQVKELFEYYNIAENPEQPQVSETISQVPEDSNRSSDDEVLCSSPSTKGIRYLKPKSLNPADCTKLTPVTTESTKKETYQKNKQSQSSLREKLRMKSANSRPAFDRGNRKTIKKPEKAKQESNKKSEVKKQGNKSVESLTVPLSPSSVEDNAPGNKENMDVDAIIQVV